MVEDLAKKKGKAVRLPKERSKLRKGIGKLVTEKPWRIIVICSVFLIGLA